MEPLTEEQRKFAEEHAGLIWWFIDRYHLGKGNAEERHDWYFILAEAYLQAVLENNPKIPCSYNNNYGMRRGSQPCLFPSQS